MSLPWALGFAMLWSWDAGALSIHPLYQLTLSIHPINLLYQTTLLTPPSQSYLINAPYQHHPRLPLIPTDAIHITLSYYLSYLFV